MKFIAFAILSAAIISACSKNESTENIKNQAIRSASDIETNLVVATGRVEPDKEIINLSASEGGIVKTVLKKEGTIAAPGELLVQLEDDFEQSKINQIRASIETQQNQVEIEKIQLIEIQTNLDYKLQLLEKAKKLVAKGAETQQVVDDLNTEIDVLNVKSAEARIQIQAAQNKVNELNAQLSTAQIEIRKKQFYAPVGGQLLNITVMPGESVAKYDAYAEFAPEGNYIVKAEVDELFALKVKAGQQAEIVNTGSTEVIATGEIYYVSPYFKRKSLFSGKTDEQEDRRVREIKILLKNKENLIINAKVECRIKL